MVKSGGNRKGDEVSEENSGKVVMRLREVTVVAVEVHRGSSYQGVIDSA